MQNSKALIGTSIQYKYDLIKIFCQELYLVSLEYDRVNNCSFPNFQNLMITFHWILCSHIVNAVDCCGIVRHDLNVFMAFFTNGFRSAKNAYSLRTLKCMSFSSGSHTPPVDSLPIYYFSTMIYHPKHLWKILLLD